MNQNPIRQLGNSNKRLSRMRAFIKNIVPKDIKGILIGTLVSFLTTVAVAHCYYNKATKDLEIASQELKKETQNLAQLNENILTALEHPGRKKLLRDDMGNIIGIQLIIDIEGFQTEAEFGKPTIKQE